MARIERVLVPDLGDFETVDIVEVLVHAGQQVRAEDSLITLESDKATMDVPAPLTGRVQEVSVRAGDKVARGDLILTLEVAAEAAAAPAPTPGHAPPPAAPAPAPAAPAPAAPLPATPRAAAAPPAPASAEDHAAFTKAYASPAVRRYARELGVDLARVRGSGRQGRIVKEDVQGFVKETLARPAASTGGALPAMPVVDFAKFGEIERRPLTRVQRIAGPHLHRSWLHVPHVTQHDEADITELEAFRKAQGPRAEREGVKLTFLPFLMKAAVAALKQHPLVNASLDPDGEHVILKRYYHLGIAVDTPQGLVVPVIRDVDEKGLFELARELAEVSVATREGKLTPERLRGGSFTLSSLGGIGGGHFTPIVNAPEVAILGIGRARERPVWDGAAFVPRLVLPLSLSYDHRVIDGALGVRFTTLLAELLGDLRRLLL
jgi:pyruvate dehydrogenase E2 component (dihydrolipoamide acetyltransferase)